MSKNTEKMTEDDDGLSNCWGQPNKESKSTAKQHKVTAKNSRNVRFGVSVRMKLAAEGIPLVLKEFAVLELASNRY